MVRPKGSQHNINLAVAFCDVLVMKTIPGEEIPQRFKLVNCKGRRSLYAAFAACLPNLARDSKEKRPRNRQGVAAIELNKALHLNGLKSIRVLRRLDDQNGLKFSIKVWEHCRWADPEDPEDSKVLVDKLLEVQNKHEELKECTSDQLKEVLQGIFAQGEEAELEDDRSGEEEQGEECEQSSPRPIKAEASEFFFPAMQSLPSLQAHLEHGLHGFPPANSALPSAWLPPSGGPSGGDQIQANLSSLYGMWPNSGVMVPQPIHAADLMASLTNTRGGLLPSHIEARPAHSDSASGPTYTQDHRRREIEALRAQVAALERTIELVAMQERDALRLLPVLLTERSILLTENAKLVAECAGLRSDRNALMAEIHELRRMRP